MRMARKAPIRKLVAGGASGATLGPMLATLAIYLAESVAGHGLPTDVRAAVFGVCVWLATLGTAYLVPPAPGDVPLPAPPKVPPAGIP